MSEILTGLGDGSFSRELLGEVLGYSNARGGPGARKIAALAQYGFLQRRAGLYSPTSLAREALASSEAARRGALQRALQHPPLFAALLDRYEPQGRVPAQLAGVLWRDYGITQKASHVAAATFYKSARYAGVLDRDGAFVPDSESSRPPDAHQEETRQARQDSNFKPPTNARRDSKSTEQRFEFALTSGKVARLFLPLELCRRDLEIVRKQIDFLEYQVREEDRL